jgi:4-amino-4-deoxy-L-arabinose transferase-like glycosyltransferase
VSRAPTRSPGKGGGGTRSFNRRQKLERERAARRRTRQTRVRKPSGFGDIRAQLRRVPRVAWICALIAVLNAAAWSVITPPFQGRDEVDHFAYVARLAETGKQPHRIPGAPYTYSRQEQTVMQGLRYYQVRFSPYEPSLTSKAEQATLNADAAAHESMTNSPQAGGASTAPPLFYALQTIPYALGGSNLLVKLQLMRLLDALLAGITALLCYFFLRLTVPKVPWAATVGTICIALQPTFAFVSGSVNPDALLYPLSAAVLLMLALGFRRKLSTPMAVGLGAVIAAGLLTYYSFIGVALGAVAALAILAVRDLRRGGERIDAIFAPAIAAGIGLSPGFIYIASNISKGHPAFGAVNGTTSELNSGSLGHEIAYAWQLFLPRLPGMAHFFEGITTWREIWFDRSVGLYGWMDTMFPTWVENVALLLAIGTAVLCISEILARRDELRARRAEIASYVVVFLAVIAMLGIASYKGDVIEHEIALGEPRYLLVMLPFLGAAIALAVRGAGRRWVPVLGAAMIVLFLGHDLFSQLQVIARYYG